LTQQEDKIYFMAYPLHKDVFYTRDTIILQFLIINTLDQGIMIERIDCSIPKNFTKGASDVSRWSLGKASLKYFNISIKANAPDDYLIGPAILHYSKGGTNRCLSAGLINVHVINRNPEIKDVRIQQIKYPGLISDEAKFQFSAKLSDPDGPEDIKSWEVWSNIKGLLNNSSNPCKDYAIDFSRSDLPVGTHTITFTIRDQNSGLFQKEMILDVTPCTLKEYSGFTCIALIIAVCALIGAINIIIPRINQLRKWRRKYSNSNSKSSEDKSNDTDPPYIW